MGDSLAQLVRRAGLAGSEVPDYCGSRRKDGRDCGSPVYVDSKGVTHRCSKRDDHAMDVSTERHSCNHGYNRGFGEKLSQFASYA